MIVTLDDVDDCDDGQRTGLVLTDDHVGRTIDVFVSGGAEPSARSRHFS